MHRVLVAVGAKLVQLKPIGGIPTVLGGGVAGYSRRSLIGICATLGAFQRDNNSDALLSSHSPRK